MAPTIPPSLAALRVFETAARHLSFKNAAIELGVTPSAVSHAISALEGDLGVKLFHRRVRQLLLTDAGRTYHAKLIPLFEGIAEATREISTRSHADIFTVASPPAFARAWLMPRLKHFIQSNPAIGIRIRATSVMSEMIADDVDAFIVYGRSSGPDVLSYRLMSEDMVPVCSPNYRAEGRVIRSLADIAECTLIHTETKIVTWAMWLHAAGVTDARLDHGLHFNRADLALEAAISGLGIALESRVLAEAHLVSGALTIPFEARAKVAEEGSYFLSTRPYKARLPKVEAFRDWILREAATHTLGSQTRPPKPR